MVRTAPTSGALQPKNCSEANGEWDGDVGHLEGWDV